MDWRTRHLVFVAASTSVVFALFTVVKGQHKSTYEPDGSIGEQYTKVVASYNLGDPHLTTWTNITQSDFRQALLPQFQADVPASTASWVQANTADLAFQLRLILSGTVANLVRLDSLYWELARPVTGAFPGAVADIAVAAVGNITDSSVRLNKTVSLNISLTYTGYPSAELPHSVDSSSIIVVLKDYLAANPTSVSSNAAAFIKNITGAQGLTQRTTNATLSYVVPSGQKERAITYQPLIDELITVSNKSADAHASSSSGLPTDVIGSYTQEIPWQLTSLRTEDVSLLHVGQTVLFNSTKHACLFTPDSCCHEGDITKGCVKQPLCMPRDAKLTLDEQICLAPSSVPCSQRSWACADIWMWGDVAAYADRLYQESRGFWDFSRESSASRMQRMYKWKYNSVNETRCAPYRILSCLYLATDRCDDYMCTVDPEGVCLTDECTTWDSVTDKAVTDPCCGFSGQCEKAPMPLNATATCVWDDSSHSCRVLRVADCSAANLTVDEKVTCRISNVMTINQDRNMSQVAQSLCSGAVTNLCASASSNACQFCQLIQSSLYKAVNEASDEARYCKANGDSSPQYTDKGVLANQASLLRSALRKVLQSDVVCNTVAEAMLPAAGAAILTAANVQAHGGAWVCDASGIAELLCDRNSTDSNNDATGGDSTSKSRDCRKCGSFMEQFAELAAAGTVSYTRTSVTSYCMQLQLMEYQAAQALGKTSDLDQDSCASSMERYNRCNPELGCEHTQQCISREPPSVESTYCNKLEGNATACNEKPACVYTPGSSSEHEATCSKVAQAVWSYGLQILAKPVDVCQKTAYDAVCMVGGPLLAYAAQGAGRINPTCGNACIQGGYCTTIGTADPQCEHACKRCRDCLAYVGDVQQALATSDDPDLHNFSGDLNTGSHIAAFKVYKTCMQQAYLTRSADITETGQCVGQHYALCDSAHKYGWCRSNSVCQQVDICAKINTVTCESNLDTVSGKACWVARVCDQTMKTAAPLPANVFCGPSHLNICALPGSLDTSPICLRCLTEAEDVQNRLRSLTNFKCIRPRYRMQTRVEQCTKYVSGWLGANLSCPVLFSLSEEWKSINKTINHQLETFEYWNYESSVYVPFCRQYQDAVMLAASNKEPALNSRQMLSTHPPPRARALMQLQLDEPTQGQDTFQPDSESDTPPEPQPGDDGSSSGSVTPPEPQPGDDRSNSGSVTPPEPQPGDDGSNSGSVTLPEPQPSDDGSLSGSVTPPEPLPGDDGSDPGSVTPSEAPPDVSTPYMETYDPIDYTMEDYNSSVISDLVGVEDIANPNPLPPACEDCSLGPSWVYDLISADANHTCVTADNITYCQVVNGLATCGIGLSDCSNVINCSEGDVSVCLAPLQRTTRKIPLRQIQNTLTSSSCTLWRKSSSVGDTEERAYSSYFPGEAVKFVYKLVFMDEQWPSSPRMPYGYGCPGTPAISQAMGLDTLVEQPETPSSSSNEMSNNSSDVLHAGDSSICWVDATVAVNLMVGALLEIHHGCDPAALDAGRRANLPYSACVNWTISWMPPNLPCDPEITTGCLNHTYWFQLDRWVPCDSISDRVDISELQRRTLYLGSHKNISVEYCRFDIRSLQIYSPVLKLNYSSFTSEGLLGRVMTTSVCKKFTRNDTDNLAIQGCPQAPMYPIGVDHLPKPLFVMPLSSYDMTLSYGLLKSGEASYGYMKYPWCPHGVQPCGTTDTTDYPPTIQDVPSTPADDGVDDYTMEDYQSSITDDYSITVSADDASSSGSPLACQECNAVPSWVTEALLPESTGVCVTSDNLTYCHMQNGTQTCDLNATNCNKIVVCPESDVRVCLAPLQHKTLMLPLRQIQKTANDISYTMWSYPDVTDEYRVHSSYVPIEAIEFVNQLVFKERRYPLSPGLQFGFGCPGTPAVMQAMGLNISNGDVSTSTDNLELDSSGADIITNGDSTVCWADARVTVNLMVASLLEIYYGCTPYERNPGRKVHLPYSACVNWTISWMPPNLPCDPEDTAGCLNHTYWFQLERWVPCDNLKDRVEDINLLQKRVLATETPDEVSSTEYCHYDTRRQQPVAPEYVPNYSTFTAEGPLGDVIRSRLCEKVKNTYADSALPGCRTPAFYPLAVDYLPKALFAMPFGSYDLDKGYGLSKSAAASGVKADLPWCPSWVQPCSTTQAPDNPQPPGNPSTPPTYMPEGYYNDNGNEGWFKVEHDYVTNTTSYVYQDKQRSMVDEAYTHTSYYWSPMTWSSTDSMCRIEMSTVTRATRAGYVEDNSLGMFNACVDHALARGSPDYLKKLLLRSFMKTCNQTLDVCCTPFGVEAGSKAVCESRSPCSFSASCTVQQDNCYDQFSTSFNTATNVAICHPSCSFQPLAMTTVGTAFKALPTIRTAANGSLVVQEGICYNRTVWDRCTSKTSEATCKLWVGGNNICSWVTSCKPSTANLSFHCQRSADSCCLESVTAVHDGAKRAACAARRGDGGRPCKVQQQCYLVKDACAQLTTPWDCIANTACQFTPSPTSTQGGICSTLLQRDPCRTLTASACSNNPACTVADRCVTDRCPDPTDTCCGLAGQDAACQAEPTCTVVPTCLPATDECAVYTDARTCNSTETCLWKPSGTSTGSTPSPSSCIMDAARHPCTSARDAQACYRILDITGKPRCYLQSNCMSGCSRCADCLSEVSMSLAAVLGPPGTASLDASRISLAFRIWCSTKGIEASVCGRVATAIAFSAAGNLAKRPGMLCTLAGQCLTGCSVPVRDSSGHVVSKQPVDLCTDTGTAAGTPVPLPNKSSAHCLVDGDCKEGEWCRLDAGAEEVCKCVDGKDVCSIMGVCNHDICPRLSALTTLNRGLKSCTSDSDCDDQAGMVCEEKAYQTYDCSNSLVTATNHTGHCVEAAPAMLAPQLDDKAASIVVTLSADAELFVASCSALLTRDTMLKLGKDAICAVRGQESKQLVVLLQNVPNLAWGNDRLVLQANQTILRSRASGRSFAGLSSSAVAKCSNCPAPTAILSGPTLVTKPCPDSDVADFAAVHFSASGSIGTAAAPITDVSWQLVRGDSAGLTAALDFLNSRADLRDKMVLRFDGTTLESMEVGIYNVAITVTNSLEQSSSAVAQFAVADAGSKPSIAVFAPGRDASGSVVVEPSKGLKLHSKLQVDSVCKGTPKVNYRWTCSAADGSSCSVPAEAATAKQLMMSAQSLIAFKLLQDYTFTLTAGFTGSTITSSASVVVRFARSPLQAVLLGPMGDVPATRSFTLDASKSMDPDNPAASLRYELGCSPQPCFSDLTYTGVQTKQSMWTIDASKLIEINREYTFTVTVSGSTTGDNRRATASLAITPKPGSPPTGIISRFCGFDTASNPLPCLNNKHNPSQNLVVSLKLHPESKDASVLWLFGGSDQQLHQLQEGVNAQGVRRTTLTVLASVLPSAGSVRLQAIMSMPGVNGTASITVPLNTPPSCPDPPCFSTDTNSTVFPDYTFLGTASGWQDADGDVLMYEFGQVVDKEYKPREAAIPSSTYVFRGFEPGNYQLYACAVDTSGARTCATSAIAVLKPQNLAAEAKAALVDASVAKIDVEKLASTGDVSAVTNAMQEFASLAAFAATAATDDISTTPGTTNSDLSTSPSSPSLSPALIEKQNALLTTLSAVMNTEDPAAMSSSMDAADKVSDAGSAGLSEEAGEALLDVVDGFLAANGDSAAAGLNEGQFKTAAKVLSKGVTAVSKGDTAEKGSSSGAAANQSDPRRHLLSLADANTAAYMRLSSSLTGLVTLLSAGTPEASSKVAGTHNICMSASRDDALSGGLDSKEVRMDCSTAVSALEASVQTPESGQQREMARSLLATAAVGVVRVVMPSEFGAACAADPICSAAGSTVVTQAYVADPIAVLRAVKDWPGAKLVPGAASLLSAISGVHTLGLGSRASGPICSSSSSCSASITLPVTGYNPLYITACVRLTSMTGDANAMLQASLTGVAIVTDSVTSSSVTCRTEFWGSIVVVQYTPAKAAVTDQPPVTPALAPVNPAAVPPPPVATPPAITIQYNTSQQQPEEPVQGQPAAAADAAFSPAPLGVQSSPPISYSNNSSSSGSQASEEGNFVYDGLDNSSLSATDIGRPVAFTFTFSNYNLDQIMASGSNSNTTEAAFHSAVKEAFLVGVAAKTGLRVTTADNKLQLNRVNILNIKAGSVIIDLEFLPPATASASDITALQTAVLSNTTIFFATPSFVAAYGSPQVSGRVLEQLNHSPAPTQDLPATEQKELSAKSMQVGVGVGVGIGGSLLISVAIVCAIMKNRRDAARLAPSDAESAAGADDDAHRKQHDRVAIWPTLQPDSGV